MTAHPPPVSAPITVRPALLVLPGWDDDAPEQYERLRDELAGDWACRRADLPDAGWPASQRDAATRGSTLQQTLADYDRLHAAAHPGARPAGVAALGFSYGGYMAALLTHRRPVQALVLRAPALYPDEDWGTPKAELDKRELRAYRHARHDARDNLALTCCAAFRGDVLLVQCERDEIIPPPVYESYARALQSARSFTRHVLRGADHALSQEVWRVEYHHVAIDWLRAREAEWLAQPARAA